jgi:hypothetical protein
MANEIMLLTLLAVGLMVGVLAIGLASIWRRERREEFERITNELAAINARMDRVMTAVDVVAVEVERIGEADRFAVKALAARHKASAEGRVITPH